MQIVPLAPSCGVEITGVQLADAAGATLDDVREAVYAHGVAVLRGQELSPQEHIAFAQRWGGIDINNYFPLTDEHPEIAVVRKRENQQTNIGGGWIPITPTIKCPRWARSWWRACCRRRAAIRSMRIWERSMIRCPTI